MIWSVAPPELCLRSTCTGFDRLGHLAALYLRLPTLYWKPAEVSMILGDFHWEVYNKLASPQQLILENDHPSEILWREKCLSTDVMIYNVDMLV